MREVEIVQQIGYPDLRARQAVSDVIDCFANIQPRIVAAVGRRIEPGGIEEKILDPAVVSTRGLIVVFFFITVMQQLCICLGLCGTPMFRNVGSISIPFWRTALLGISSTICAEAAARPRPATSRAGP